MTFLPTVFKQSTFFTSQANINYLQMLPQHYWYMWLCQCLNMVLIAEQLSLWMLAIIVLALLWQVSLIYRSQQQNTSKKYFKSKQLSNPGQILPSIGSGMVPHTYKSSLHVSPIILAIFAICGCITIALHAKQLGVLASMVHLLCFAYALKSLELKTRSDLYQLVLLGVFVIASSLIFKQNLAFSAVVFLLLILNLIALLQYFSFEKKMINSLKTMIVLIVQSTLLAIVLFLVFPRLSPFWQVPNANIAKTGLSDNVKPGDIAQLTRSTKLAFRVDFGQQAVPSYSSLYWRAMVLEYYDGFAWTTKSSASDKVETDDLQVVEPVFDASQTEVLPLNYRVIAEPSYQHYLFALTPAVVNPKQADIKASKGYTFQSNKVITQAKSYQLTSFLTAPTGIDLSNEQQTINRSYPKGSNPRLEALAANLKQNYATKMQRAQAVLDMINQELFSYTLQPPLLSDNSLDQFFFDTRAGFCAHYASAFTFLMRASGIPARMVTGYLGGEYNDINDQQDNAKQGHLSVYQYDAHAWSEIWIEDKGWIRIDPTAAVDLQRINSGWSEQLLREQSSFENNIFSLYRMKNITWLSMLRLHFDALDYQWTRWVIGFTAKQQLTLFKEWFGNMAHWKLVVIIAVSLMLSMVGLMLLLHLTHYFSLPKKSEPVWQILYYKILTQLAKQGIEKPISMTPEQFSSQIRRDFPSLALIFSRFTACYSRLCYKPLTETERRKLMVMMKQHYKTLTKSISAKH